MVGNGCGQRVDQAKLLAFAMAPSLTEEPASRARCPTVRVNPHGSAYGVCLASLVAKKLRRAAGLNGAPRKLACLEQRAGVEVASLRLHVVAGPD